MLTFDVVETVLETAPYKGFVYRMRETHAGVLLYRVPEDKLWWTHGVIRQTYDPHQDQFVMATKVSSAYALNLPSRDAALEVIERQ